MKTTLPKKWVINREGLPEVIEWCNNNNDASQKHYEDYKLGWYFHFPSYGGNSHTSSYIKTGYEEITFDEFKVLNFKKNIETI